jgi:uncharacterized repeat protein (TIGR01451 family)
MQLSNSRFFSVAIAAMAATFLSSSARADVSALWACQGITINQSGPATAAPGGALDYEIRVHNAGNCDIQDALVSDFIPRTSVFTNANPAPSSYPAGPKEDEEHPVAKISWENVRVLPNGDVTFRLQAHVKNGDSRLLLNTACIESPELGRVCSELETTVSP